MKLRIVVILLLWSALSFAQEPASPPVPPVPMPAAPAQQAPTAPTPAPPDSAPSPAAPNAPAGTEAKITPQQAKELFQSVDEILEFVSADTGLPIKHPVKRQLASRDEVGRYIESHMQDDEDTQRLEHSAVVLKKFGLLPHDFDLQKFLLEMLREQVAGYYDSKTKTVYLLDWVEPEQQKPVLAHELTHALQDQNFGLERLSKNTKKHDPTGLEEDERQEALQAMIEGQGMIVLIDYMLAPMGTSVARQPEMADAAQAGLSPSDPGMAVYNRAPRFLQQVLIFPYRYGTLFEKDVLLAGGKEKAFAGALKTPPADTHQIMQPQAYLQGERVPPLAPVDFNKLAAGYRRWDVSGMGAFDVFLLGTEYSTPEMAKNLSDAARGGYYWAAQIPGTGDREQAPATAELALAYVSRWTDPGAAGRFAGTYSEAVPKRYPGARQVQGQIGPVLQEAPGAGIQVSITPQLSAAVAWQTSEGTVTIEPRGNMVLVLENFDPQTASAIRKAVFP
jgi:hypothetical protein